MPHISTRITRLEESRPTREVRMPDLDVPPDTCARIAVALAAGTYPHSLADADLQAIVRAGDNARGRA